MTTDKQDPNRAAFEAQCEYLGESTRRSVTDQEQYSSSTTAIAWAMWQASREQALSACANELRGMTANHKVAQSAINQCAEALEALK